MIATETRAEVIKLKALLQAAPVGAIVTLEAMSDAIGLPIERNRWMLYSATRQLQAEQGIVFSSVRSQGYRRLPAEEIPTIGETARKRIRRTAARGARAIQAGVMGANDLSDATRRRLMQEQGALSLLSHLARDKALPQVTDSAAPPTMADTARQFMARMGIKAQ